MIIIFLFTLSSLLQQSAARGGSAVGHLSVESDNSTFKDSCFVLEKSVPQLIRRRRLQIIQRKCGCAFRTRADAPQLSFLPCIRNLPQLYSHLARSINTVNARDFQSCQIAPIDAHFRSKRRPIHVNRKFRWIFNHGSCKSPAIARHRRTRQERKQPPPFSNSVIRIYNANQSKSAAGVVKSSSTLLQK